MTYTDFTSFFVITPPTPTDNRDDESGGGPWGRWNADGSPIASLNYGIDAIPLEVSQVSGQSYKIVNATEGGGAPANFWATVQGVQVGDYVCYRTATGAERGYVTGFSTTTVTGDTLLVTAWNTWSGDDNRPLKIGGSLKTLGNAAGWNAYCTTSFINSDSKPPCLWIQTGNTFSGSVTFANNGSNAIPLSIRGYVTTPGDACDGTNRPVVSNTASSGSALTLSSRQYLLFENLIVQHTHASNSAAVVTGYTSSNVALSLKNCKVTTANNCSSGGMVALRGYGHRLIGCDIQGVSAGSLLIVGLVGNVTISGCYLLRGGFSGGSCFTAGNQFAFAFDKSVIKTVQGGIVFALSGTLTGCASQGCVFDGLATGVTMVSASQEVTLPYFQNCIFMPYAGTTLFPAGRAVHVDNCATYGTLGTVFGDNNITLSGNPFVDSSNGDYRINLSSAAGRQLFVTGYPSSIPSLSLSTNYIDVGACQSRPLLTPEIIA